MGISSFALTGPFSSIGVPKTSTMRPRVSHSTGIDIGAPVLVTSRPRESPSEVPMVIVRTMPSPSCCCTSNKTAVSYGKCASYTFGTLFRSNSTSMTAPIICTIRPLLISSLFLCDSFIGLVRVFSLWALREGYTAAAPPTISEISCVIAACRALL